MSSPSLRIRRRLLPVTIVAAVTALALTGCEPGVLAPTESPEPSSSPTVTPEPSESETPGSGEPTETDAPEQSGSPEPTTPPVAGELPCTEVFTADQLYDFNPNFAPTSDQGELPGAIGEIADAGGTVCAYQHVTGSDRLVIAVLQDAGGFSGAGFETVGDEGVSTVPSGGTVVAAASIYFASAQDARPYIDEVIANLG
ncbi:hypothetical protein [Agrococcus baldri]|uniref:DUF3558 domain-containing protein n=1 Tax=Agrococcus baldri TaxID=153730 RepID=A0AA87RE28_9MICO|nr:hypothetical protein [Agrococcus baldri]GEK80992.1 hypothetical protein ABA31_23430 [Agrococcus baldri]